MTCPCVKSELDLFSVPLEQTSIESGQWVETKPIASLTNSSIVEFHVPGSSDDYQDPSNMYLQLKARIKCENGTVLAGDKEVGPVNGWMHALFKEIVVTLNGVNFTIFNYAYKADIENRLSFGKGTKKTQLGSILWYKDTVDMEDLTTNTGFVARRALTLKSKTVDMCGKLNLDINNQDKYLPNGVDMDVKLVRSSDDFSLMSDDSEKFKVEIVDASLFIRRIKLFPEVQAAHIKAFEKSPAKYNIQRKTVKAYTLGMGGRSFAQENVYNGQLPKRLIIAMVDNKAYNGEQDKNPFNYKHYNLTSLSVCVDGKQVPSKPLRPDFANGQYARAYVNLFAATGKFGEDEDNYITYADFANGDALFAFDLTPDLSADSDVHTHLRRGNLRVELSFKENLTETVTLLTYGEFDNTILIDQHKNVMSDFHAA